MFDHTLTDNYTLSTFQAVLTLEERLHHDLRLYEEAQQARFLRMKQLLEDTASRQTKTDHLKQRYADAVQQMEMHQAESERRSREVSTLQETVRSASLQLADRDARLRMYEESGSEWRQRFEHAEREIASLRSELTSEKAMREKYQAMVETLKEVLREKGDKDVSAADFNAIFF